MQMVKVYNAKGKHVDSFRKTKDNFTGQVQLLNKKGLFVRHQFSQSGKTLMRSY